MFAVVFSITVASIKGVFLCVFLPAGILASVIQYT